MNQTKHKKVVKRKISTKPSRETRNPQRFDKMTFVSGRYDTYHAGKMGDYNQWGRVVEYTDNDVEPMKTQEDIDFIDDGSQSGQRSQSEQSSQSRQSSQSQQSGQASQRSQSQQSGQASQSQQSSQAGQRSQSQQSSQAGQRSQSQQSGQMSESETETSMELDSMNTNELRDLCNDIGITCRDENGKYLSKQEMIRSIAYQN
jgi:hypothetical protein